ncbi:MAG: hypothetical protein JWR28_1374, partial [Modestobacter sp.]|nr:hypothetical protein [Modestobacter sp.]
WRAGRGIRALSVCAGVGLVLFEAAELLWLGFQPLEAVFAALGATVAGLALIAAPGPVGVDGASRTTSCDDEVAEPPPPRASSASAQLNGRTEAGGLRRPPRGRRAPAARLGSKTPVHPNDDVNKSQSSNDTFPTAMHLAVLQAVIQELAPSVRALHAALDDKAVLWADVVKIGRTHLEDAVPLTVGQEWSGYARQLADGLQRLLDTLPALYEIALGGTAVGTGLNAPVGFDVEVAAELAALTGIPFVTAPNKFAALGGLDAVVAASAGLRALAVPLMKIANDVRWAASGPRCGIGELVLPANEPGSSIMPGKINPTQCESMVMVCIQVLAEDSAVAFAGSQGNFELNTMRPIVINNVLHSARRLTDATRLFREFCIEGTTLNRPRIEENLERSLMLVTALSPAIGYDAASAVAQRAAREGTTLREAALAQGVVTAADFDRLVDPRAMTAPRSR